MSKRSRPETGPDELGDTAGHPPCLWFSTQGFWGPTVPGGTGVGGQIASVGPVRGGNQAAKWATVVQRRLAKFHFPPCWLRAAFSYRKRESSSCTAQAGGCSPPSSPILTLPPLPRGQAGAAQGEAFPPCRDLGNGLLPPTHSLASGPPVGPFLSITQIWPYVQGEKQQHSLNTLLVLGDTPGTPGHRYIPHCAGPGASQKGREIPDSLLFPLSGSQRARHFSPPSQIAFPSGSRNLLAAGGALRGQARPKTGTRMLLWVCRMPRSGDSGFPRSRSQKRWH